MNLSEALHAIASRFALDETALYTYTQEDTLGGYHNNPAHSHCMMGSIWEVEGQILYALVRALKPRLAVEIGSYYGCSTFHIAEAMKRNDYGKLVAVDLTFYFKVPERYENIIELNAVNLFDYAMPKGRVEFVFEDAMHTNDSTYHTWRNFADSAVPGAMIVSHDAMHETLGATVRHGMTRVTPDFLTVLVEPGQCGLGMWRKPVD